jgi:hypothetical protein
MAIDQSHVATAPPAYEPMEVPPYGTIWNTMKEGGVIPFLGAGASMFARPPTVRFNPLHPEFLPSGAELAECLADETRFPVGKDDPQRQDLAKVASYFVDQGGRKSLSRRLREMLNVQSPTGDLHRFIATLRRPQIVVVTNYDHLLELAFKEAGEPYDLVVHATGNAAKANVVQWWPHGQLEPSEIEPSQLAEHLNPEERTVIYKMHGNVHQSRAEWDNFVITEEDYVDFVSRMATKTAVPPVFYEYFHKHTFLFLGYSLRDWNLRVIWRDLAKYFVRNGPDEERSWAIQHGPSVLERRLWKNKNVNIYDVDISAFVKEMEFERLRNPLRPS